MKPRAAASRFILLSIWLFAVFFLFSCLSPDDRMAGSSTEAGNAGGKLSLADGSPAAGVSVALVSRGYLPDTLGVSGSGDVEGKYYRTLTERDGSFRFKDVASGSYRVMALDSSLGASVDSVTVVPGDDTLFINEVMKPLGGISGVAKIVGAAATVSNVWISPKSTLLQPPLANAAGAFRLDSLPEGVYELVPQCFSCRPVSQGYRVTVKAGKVTVLDDTLELYPEYFFGFPDSGDLFLRSAWLPVPIGGKINRGDEDRILPASVAWTWNGRSVAGTDITTPKGIAETSVLVDSSWFDGSASGRLRLVLSYPDTSISREWRVALDTAERIWPLSAVAVSGAVRIPGPVGKSVWRFHVTDSRPLDPAAAEYWKLLPGIPPNAAGVPEWVELDAGESGFAALGGMDTAQFTFFLVPDSLVGGRVFRPRRDERLEDISHIRFLALARFGFSDSLEPSMRPDGLLVDRRRGPQCAQRYHIDSAGGVREVLGGLTAGKPPMWPTEAGSPLIFYRSGPAAAGYAWDKPLRDASRVLAVNREGLAMRLDGSAISVRVPDAELDSLRALLEPLALDAPALADSGNPSAAGSLDYLFMVGRGLLWNSGTRSAADALSAGIRAWMGRNGLDESPRYPLEPGGRTWLAFVTDASGWRYTGDTLVAEFSDSAGGAVVTERLTAGSPGRPADPDGVSYYLKVVGDSLTATSDSTVVSRLFGKIDELRGLFPLVGLGTVSPAFTDGIPVLTDGGNTLSGRLAGSLEIGGRQVVRPGIFLDGRALKSDKLGQGSLYTPEGGLERTWRFGGRTGSVAGWERL